MILRLHAEQVSAQQQHEQQVTTLRALVAEAQAGRVAAVQEQTEAAQLNQCEVRPCFVC